MKPLYILKIGGSVATFKDRAGMSVRTELLKKVARAIHDTQKSKDFQLILIHGAGAAGHQLAREFNLKEGVKGIDMRREAALRSRGVNQKLDGAIFEILIAEGIRATPVHTASVVIQKNCKILKFHFETVAESLRQNYIPLLYGEMVFDSVLEMSICSGDALAAALAKKFDAQKILFASDIDGIFNRDPYLHKDAELIKNTTLEKLRNLSEISESHNIDATGGLQGKIKQIQTVKSPSLKTIEFFNGMESTNYKHALLGDKFEHTVIKF